MSLRDPDTRRALRSVVQAIVALAVLALAFWLTHLLRDDVPGLREISRYALAIIGLGTFGYMLENTTRAFRAKLGIAEVSSDAAQEVADAAQDKATQIKDTPG